MHIPEYINNISEGVKFCDRYGISCTISSDNKLNVTNPPDITYHEKFRAMEDAARKTGITTDHPNCFLTDSGVFVVTFSPYDGELSEEEQRKIRRKGYDIRLCDYDLYGYGTKTYVMAELVSPLDVED